jgi:Flp pilus assembly protein TadD
MLNGSFKQAGDAAGSHPEPVTFMCRMSALAATALAVSLLSGPVMAKEQSKAPAAAADARRKATPEERAAVNRLDPLARAAFWGRELSVNPDDAEAGVQLSQALRGMGAYDDALQAAQRVLVSQPNNVEALLEVARGQISRNQGFYAIEPARQAQALAPRDWRAPSLLGVAYEQAQRNDEALAAHRQAVALAPDNAAPISNLALFYAAHGQKAEAETLLRQAASKPGATIAIRQNLALLVGLQGRLDEAERLVRQDLPPEAVANNMAWLRGATSPTPTGAPARSWEGVRTAQ